MFVAFKSPVYIGQPLYATTPILPDGNNDFSRHLHVRSLVKERIFQMYGMVSHELVVT